MLAAISSGAEAGELAGLQPVDRALLDYAARLTREPVSMCAGDVQALRAEGIAEADILLANLIVAYFSFVNRIALGLGGAFDPAEVAGYDNPASVAMGSIRCKPAPVALWRDARPASQRAVRVHAQFRPLRAGRRAVGSDRRRPLGRSLRRQSAIRTGQPLALETLRAGGCNVDGVHSKHWNVFSGPGSQAMDFVVTACDNAAGETCPVWPGTPVSLHWGFADPSGIGNDHVSAADPD